MEKGGEWNEVLIAQCTYDTKAILHRYQPATKLESSFLLLKLSSKCVLVQMAFWWMHYPQVVNNITIHQVV